MINMKNLRNIYGFKELFNLLRYDVEYTLYYTNIENNRLHLLHESKAITTEAE